MAKALVVVDVQNDFVEGGALGVNGGLIVSRRLNDWVATQHWNYDLIVASQDWHIDPGLHWSDNPDYVDSWPVHCAADTLGAALTGDWDWAVDVVVKKGQYAAAYSAFEGVTRFGKLLNDWLSFSDITEVDVVGIAYDYCVKATALDSVTAGYKTRILTDLTAPVHQDKVGELEHELQTAGVELALSGLTV